MRSSSRILLTVLLATNSALAEPPWESSELGWLSPTSPVSGPTKERTRHAPEYFAAIQADGNFVAPRDASGPELQLLDAVARRDVAAVRTLLVEGASPNVRDYWQDSPLLVSVRLEDIELVQVLLDAGARVDVKGRGYTPLGLAARNNNLTIIQHLLRAGADPDRKSDDGDYPIHAAVRAGHGAVVERLLSAGADLLRFDRDGLSPLALAAAYGRESIAAMLLDAGAPIEWGDREQRSPLWWALYRKHEDLARYLVKRGAKVGTMWVEELE